MQYKRVHVIHGEGLRNDKNANICSPFLKVYSPGDLPKTDIDRIMLHGRFFLDSPSHVHGPEVEAQGTTEAAKVRVDICRGIKWNASF